MNFHECIKSGSLEELRSALNDGADVDASGEHGETPLILAIEARDVEKMQLLLENGADPEIADDFNRTPLSHAVGWDFTDAVRRLLELGCDRGYAPKYPLKSIEYDFDALDLPMPESLEGVLSEAEWKESLDSQEEAMAELGRNPTIEPVIRDVQSVEVLELFLTAGDELRLAPREVKREYIGLKDTVQFESTKADYRANRSPRFGTANPEPMDNPFWSDMIRMGSNAYSARQHFSDTESLNSAVWCYERFGASLTRLTDGRFVEIAGEHEDYYDPDFYIYNDVVVHNGLGGFQVFGYPEDVFPPTDFHSATLVGDAIYIIGCLGYTHQRKLGTTPVFRLSTDDWRITSVTTSGDIPSWLHDHRATFDVERNVICVKGGNVLTQGTEDELEIEPNESRYELDVTELRWRKN